MVDLVVRCKLGSPEAVAVWKGREYPALVGRNGPIAAEEKREGDGCTPLGRMRMLYGFYRADRLEKPAGKLSWRRMQPEDRWCEGVEDIHDPLYNQLIPVDYPEPAEGDGMWKEDNRFDITVVLDWNMPAVPGQGSAIFLHVMRENPKSFGCILMKAEDLRLIAGEFALGDGVDVRLG